MAYEALMDAVKELPEASIYDLIDYVEYLKYKLKISTLSKSSKQDGDDGFYLSLSVSKFSYFLPPNNYYHYMILI